MELHHPPTIHTHGQRPMKTRSCFCTGPNRVNVLLPKRFQIHEIRVLPLALVYLLPADAEDIAS